MSRVDHDDDEASCWPRQPISNSGATPAILGNSSDNSNSLTLTSRPLRITGPKFNQDVWRPACNPSKFARESSNASQRLPELVGMRILYGYGTRDDPPSTIVFNIPSTTATS